MKEKCKRALGWLLMAALTVCAACFFGSALTVDAEAANPVLTSSAKRTIEHVEQGYWISKYATEDFSAWVEDKYGDDITLSEWISDNNASGWISTSGMENIDSTLAEYTNRYLLEACLLYEYYDYKGMANSTNDGSSIYLHEGMSQEDMIGTIVNLIGLVVDAQGSYDCIYHSLNTADCLNCLGIIAYVRYDITGSLTDSSKGDNHYNVVAFPFGTDDDDAYYVIDTDGITSWLKETEKWEYEVLDSSAKTCRVTRYNGLNTETLTIPSTIGDYTVVEVYTGVGTNAAYEKAFNLARGIIDTSTYSKYLTSTTTVVVPSTVTKLDEYAFCYTNGTSNYNTVTTVVGMTGVTSIGNYAFPTICTTLNFLDNSTSGSTVNVIPSTLAIT